MDDPIAEFWQPSADGAAIDCTLCYRRCRLADGQDGWCRYRGNRDGRMELHHHGELGVLYPFIFGYGIGSLCYYPGLPMLGVGTLHCTAGCSFCCVSGFSTHPERTQWPQHQWQSERPLDPFYNVRFECTPEHVIEVAQHWGMRELFFSYAEALLAFEFVRDTTRAALAAGITSTIFTNGFSGPEPARAIAPYVRHVILGAKAGLDPAFYARWMRSPEAVETVKATASAFHEAGVLVSFTDTIPALHMQPDEAVQYHQASYYRWIRETFGPLAVLRVGEMHAYNDNHVNNAPLLSAKAKPGDAERYRARVEGAITAAHDAGLHYVYGDDASVAIEVTCHQCSALLVRRPRAMISPVLKALFGDGRSIYSLHEQHAINGHCPRCDSVVPVRLLPMDEVIAGMQRYQKRPPKTITPEGRTIPGIVFNLRPSNQSSDSESMKGEDHNA